MLGHDYAYPGYYFVTVCTYERQMLFGSIRSGAISHTAAGIMLTGVLKRVELQFDSVSVDRFVVMPNHFHVLVGLSVRLDDEPASENLSDVVRWIKNSSHRQYVEGVRESGWDRYDQRLWQESYHDHIVRNDKELETFRAYFASNVERWEEDTFF